jgi:hypothetical protein
VQGSNGGRVPSWKWRLGLLMERRVWDNKGHLRGRWGMGRLRGLKGGAREEVGKGKPDAS